MSTPEFSIRPDRDHDKAWETILKWVRNQPDRAFEAELIYEGLVPEREDDDKNS